jgi:hypothetical protein
MRAGTAQSVKREVAHDPAGAKPRTEFNDPQSNLYGRKDLTGAAPVDSAPELTISIGGYRLVSIAGRCLSDASQLTGRILVAIGRAIEEEALSSGGGR